MKDPEREEAKLQAMIDQAGADWQRWYREAKTPEAKRLVSMKFRRGQAARRLAACEPGTVPYVAAYAEWDHLTAELEKLEWRA